MINNKKYIIKLLTGQLNALVNIADPSADQVAEGRKLAVMIQALNSGDNANAQNLLELMPYINISASGEVVQSASPPPELEGLGKFGDKLKNAFSFVKKIVNTGKSAKSTVQNAAAKVTDNSQTTNRPVIDKVKNFFDKGLNPTITIDTSETTKQIDNTLAKIKKDWWKYLLGLTAATVTVVGAAKLGRK